MIVSFDVTCPYHGVVQQIHSSEKEYVYERSALFTVRTLSGSVVEVFSSFGGTLTSLLVSKGQQVSPKMVVASVSEELSQISLGSD